MSTVCDLVRIEKLEQQNEWLWRVVHELLGRVMYKSHDYFMGRGDDGVFHVADADPLTYMWYDTYLDEYR